MKVEITENVSVTAEVEITLEHILSALAEHENNVAVSDSGLLSAIIAATDVMKAIPLGSIQRIKGNTRHVIAGFLDEQAARWRGANE